MIGKYRVHHILRVPLTNEEVLQSHLEEIEDGLIRLLIGFSELSI